MPVNNAPTIGIGKLLSEGLLYCVPHHQRDYSWSEDEIDQLIQDILSSIDENSDEYFLGLMVFIPNETEKNTYNILDGQQRLVTTTIILSSIRNWLNQHGKTEDSEKLQSEFIGIREYGETELLPRMQLNGNNNQYFYDYIVNEKPLEEIKKESKEHNKYSPNYELLYAIIYCRNKIFELASNFSKSPGEASKFLFKIVRFIRDNVKVVRLIVPNEANAYTVFETLNARGLELSALDLVKNYLFGKAKTNANLRILQNNWAEMISNLINSDSEDFLKVFWTSRYGRIQLSKLFDTIKLKYKTWDAAKELSKELVIVSDQYENLYVSNSHIWNGYPQTTKQIIDSLFLINSKQLLPIILAALSKFSQQEIEKLLRLLEVLIVRYQLIIGGRTGLLEISCARLSKKIYDGTITKASKASKELSDIYPSDTIFKEAFISKQEKTNKKAHFILQKLEVTEQAGKRGFEFQPNVNLTVEHIFPKNPNQEWQDVFKDKDINIDEYKYRLGNLCLLGDPNKSLGSKGFNIKKEVYKNSKLILTRNITEYTEWNHISIENRQKKMAEIALKAWSHDMK